MKTLSASMVNFQIWGLIRNLSKSIFSSYVRGIRLVQFALNWTVWIVQFVHKNCSTSSVHPEWTVSKVQLAQKNYSISSVRSKKNCSKSSVYWTELFDQFSSSSRLFETVHQFWAKPELGHPYWRIKYILLKLSL